MNNNDKTIDVLGWLNDQVRNINQAIAELQEKHNYGKAAMCEGMREAYMRCIEKLQA